MNCSQATGGATQWRCRLSVSRQLKRAVNGSSRGRADRRQQPAPRMHAGRARMPGSSPPTPPGSLPLSGAPRTSGHAAPAARWWQTRWRQTSAGTGRAGGRGRPPSARANGGADAYSNCCRNTGVIPGPSPNSQDCTETMASTIHHCATVGPRSSTPRCHSPHKQIPASSCRRTHAAQGHTLSTPRPRHPQSLPPSSPPSLCSTRKGGRKGRKEGPG